MRGLWAVVIREWQIEWSYKVSFILRELAAIFGVVIYYFIGKMVMKRYIQIDYVLFVVTGLAVFAFLKRVVGAAAEVIRREQVEGSLEYTIFVFGSPLRLFTYFILARSSVYILDFLLYALIIPIMWGTSIVFLNFLKTLPIMFLAFILFVGLSFLNAGLILLSKRGNVVSFFVSLVFLLFGGIYYPITVLPPLLQRAAHIVGLYKIVEQFRATLLYGIWPKPASLLSLFWAALVVCAIGILVAQFAFSKARQTGKIFYS